MTNRILIILVTFYLDNCLLIWKLVTFTEEHHESLYSLVYLFLTFSNEKQYSTMQYSTSYSVCNLSGTRILLNLNLNFATEYKVEWCILREKIIQYLQSCLVKSSIWTSSEADNSETLGHTFKIARPN